MSSYAYRSSFETVGRDSDPDILYYNADIVASAFSNASLGLDKDPAIRFQETRSVPLISDISKYMFSIIRFTMNGPGKDLPLLIPSINDTQSDINLTTYSVTLVFTVTYQNPLTSVKATKTFTAQRFIQYETETILAPLPNPPNLVIQPTNEVAGQDLRGQYYYVYTYQHWLDLVNKTFRLCWNSLDTPAPNTANPTGSIVWQYNNWWTSIGGNTGNQYKFNSTPPFMTYNENDGLFSIYGNAYCCGDPLTQGAPITAWSYQTSSAGLAVSGANTQNGSEYMEVWFNTDMFGMFANFNNFYLGQELPYGKTNQILFQLIQTPVGNTNFITSQELVAFSTNPADSQPKLNSEDPAPTYLVMTQNYNSTSTLWSPISSIVFSSTMIPIFPEQTGTPLTYGQGNNNTPTESSADFAPIITDIAIPVERADDYRGFLSYTPTGEYRLSSFTGSKIDLRNIDIQVFWKNRINSQLYPIGMFNLSSVSIKIMFRKK